jgi:hypothetical protein
MDGWMESCMIPFGLEVLRKINYLLVLHVRTLSDIESPSGTKKGHVTTKCLFFSLSFLSLKFARGVFF